MVGVILNLAVFFAWHTFWPKASEAVLIALAAFLPLWKYKVDIMKVIGACALVGLASVFIKPLLG